MKLPEQYCSAMEELLGEEYGEYLKSFENPPESGLRVNGLKISPGQFQKISEWDLREIPWIPNGFYYEGAALPARHPHYYAGLYYLQEPSAMTPASRLPVEPGDRVLDLCAAPGGKATELAAKLGGKGFLLANDISASRAGALLKNLELAGAANILVTSESPEKLAAAWPEGFDKILVDAPCSGEGMFRRDSHMAAHWMQAGPESYTEVQGKLLEAAFRMLRPGGKLLYSTCTFSLCENEQQILKFLEAHRELSTEPVKPWYGGFERGLLGLTDAVRIYPHRMNGEGHFLVLLKKSGARAPREGRPEETEALRFPKEAEDFLKSLSRDFSGCRILVRNGQIYSLGPGMEVKPGIRYLRTGLLVGTAGRGRFEPSQALAMALRKEEFDSALNLSSEDVRTLKYLKGETIPWSPDSDGIPGRASGWQLVCTDGFPLGFAKLAGQNLKNKYHRGWRWQ